MRLRRKERVADEANFGNGGVLPTAGSAAKQLPPHEQQKNQKLKASTAGGRGSRGLKAAEVNHPETGQHPDGAYLSTTKTCGRYKNVASCAHMLTSLVRGSSGAAHTVDWQLNLRGADHHRKTNPWRRHFSRPAQSFDAVREDGQDEKYRDAFNTRENTPVDRRLDRRQGAISKSEIREVPDDFTRVPGCEGTQVGQWLHLYRGSSTDRARVKYETTLRTPAAPLKASNGEEVMSFGDNRSEIGVVDMMGKKKWYGSRSSNPNAAPPSEGGDPRLYHLSTLYVAGQEDDDNRRMRNRANTPQSR